MQIKKKMNEMKNADVRFISLVHRAANRIPFRVVKSDKEHHMGIDLSSLGRSVLKSEAKTAAPEIVGVVVFEQEDAALMASVVGVLKAEGFKVDAAQKNDDGTVLYKQADMPEDEAETTLVRLSENMAVVIKGFASFSEAMTNSVDFSEVMPASGFYHGMRTASEALGNTVQHLLQKSESPAIAASAIKSAAAKFSDYVTNLANGLPAAAFKADYLLEEVLKGKGKAVDAEDAKDGGKDDDLENANGSKKTPEQIAADKAKKDAEVAAAAIAAAPAVTAAVVAGADPAAAVAAATPAVDVAAILKAELAPLMTTISDFAEKQNKLQEQVDLIARKTEDAASALKTTVLASSKDDAALKQQAKKADADPRSGCFDSANFARRSK